MRIISLSFAAMAALSCARYPETPGSTAPADSTAAPTSGEELISRMHGRYAGKWYRALTFVQTTSRPGRPDETWYEAAIIPGKLRIDVAPVDSGNTFMYVGDSIFVFRGGKRVQAAKDRNPLMTLGFDVYGQPPEVTVAQLKEQEFDLAKVRADRWQGRLVWVVGAADGDSTSNQFWVDRERLLFVRLIEQSRTQAGPARIDIEFNKYQRLAGGWIAPEVVMRRNGQEFMREVYADVRANPELDPALFTTTEYRRPGWMR